MLPGNGRSNELEMEIMYLVATCSLFMVIEYQVATALSRNDFFPYGPGAQGVVVTGLFLYSAQLLRELQYWMFR